ncbi:hypothetical protein B0H11DRAFT_1917533 [Mycena galericulata]|nr:hypothetical protein B0H11DRAFT_1917533 [Mycena galericulata]
MAQLLSFLEKTLLVMDDNLLAYLFSFWDPHDILKFSRSSSVIQGILQQYRQLVWDPDTYFQPWFREPTALFRSTLRETGAIVSGSQILQFFDRIKYLNSDLDIFLRIGGVLQMARWLVRQGYHLTPEQPDYETFHRNVIRVSCRILTSTVNQDTGIRAVYNYQRFVASATVIYYQKIQLIAVDIDPVHHVLYDFHSSKWLSAMSQRISTITAAVMNYMTSDQVVSVFPRSTFILRKSYISKTRNEKRQRTDVWKSKYEERGFRMIHRRSRGQHNDLRQGKRTSTDCHSWIMKLKAQRLREEGLYTAQSQ